MKPIPATLKPIAISVYFRTPKRIKAIPKTVKIKEAIPKIQFLFKAIIYSCCLYNI